MSARLLFWLGAEVTDTLCVAYYLLRLIQESSDDPFEPDLSWFSRDPRRLAAVLFLAWFLSQLVRDVWRVRILLSV